MKSLNEIKSEVDQRAAIINAAGHYSLPTYGHTEDGARPHIEVNAYGYHFVIVERGHECYRLSTHDIDNLLFKIFEDVTFNLAIEYERAHRIQSKDFRRLLFKHQVKLLSQLSENWATRESQEHEQILAANPFDDLANDRIQLSSQIGWPKACEQLPLPETAKKDEG